MIVDQHKPSPDWTGWTPESRQRWLNLRAAGKSHAEIGRILGCGKGASVSQQRICRDGKMQPQAKEKPLTEAEIAEIKRLHGLGLKRREIRIQMKRGDKFISDVLGRVRHHDKGAPDPYKAAAKAIAKVKAKPRATRLKFAPPRLQSRGCCLYLIGDQKPWIQCSAPIERGSYCREHWRKCHVVFPTKQEQEAA